MTQAITDEDLIGYLVGALDSDDRVAVESHLRANPGALRRLDRLHDMLAPLAADRVHPLPPAGLATRTVARLASYLVEHEPRVFESSSASGLAATLQCVMDEPIPATEPLAFPAEPRPLPRAPREAPETRIVGGRFRPDLLVACGIGLVTFGLIFSTIGKVRARNEMVACQNALRVTHTGCRATRTAQRSLPADRPGRDRRLCSPRCAASGQIPANSARRAPRALLTIAAPASTDAYTYTLGYRATGDLVGCAPEHESRRARPRSHLRRLPASSAPPSPGPVCPHSLGMNVLYAGGNVRTTTSALIGPNNDHIFQNVFGGVAAGAYRDDVVLGRPGDRP